MKDTTKRQGTPVLDDYAAYMSAHGERMPHAARAMSGAKQAALLTSVTSKYPTCAPTCQPRSGATCRPGHCNNGRGSNNTRQKGSIGRAHTQDSIDFSLRSGFGSADGGDSSRTMTIPIAKQTLAKTYGRQVAFSVLQSRCTFPCKKKVCCRLFVGRYAKLSQFSLAFLCVMCAATATRIENRSVRLLGEDYALSQQ